MTRNIRVYADAKIVGMHEKELPKKAFVGYSAKRGWLHDAKEVYATETDDAEIEAILFATQQFKGKYDNITIICDHESVVSESKKKIVKNPSPLLNKLRQILKENDNIKLEGLKSNPAHKILTEFVNQQTK